MIEIDNSNKLIAEFMGYKQREHPYSFPTAMYWWQSADSKVFGKGTWTPVFQIGEEQYHLSWDWLIPVIRKILDICSENDDMENYHSIVDTIPDIEKTHEAVVNFIKQYNDSKREINQG